jgi:hypothetical protein
MQLNGTCHKVAYKTGPGCFYPGSEYFFIPDPRVFSSQIPDPIYKEEFKIKLTTIFLLLKMSAASFNNSTKENLRITV